MTAIPKRLVILAMKQEREFPKIWKSLKSSPGNLDWKQWSQLVFPTDIEEPMEKPPKTSLSTKSANLLFRTSIVTRWKQILSLVSRLKKEVLPMHVQRRVVHFVRFWYRIDNRPEWFDKILRRFSFTFQIAIPCLQGDSASFIRSQAKQLKIPGHSKTPPSTLCKMMKIVHDCERSSKDDIVNNMKRMGLPVSTRMRKMELCRMIKQRNLYKHPKSLENFMNLFNVKVCKQKAQRGKLGTYSKKLVYSMSKQAMLNPSSKSTKNQMCDALGAYIRRGNTNNVPGYKVVPVPADGDCAYHAFIKGIRFMHPTVRVTKSSLELRKQLIEFLQAKSRVDHVTIRRIKGGEWAEDEELQAMADAHHVCIAIWDEGQKLWFYKTHPGIPLWKQGLDGCDKVVYMVLRSGLRLNNTNMSVKDLYALKNGGGYHFESLIPV